MRRLAVLGVLVAACTPPAWVAPPSDEADDPAPLLRVWRRAAAEREADFREALHPGARRAARNAALAHAGLEELRDEGERLFALDAPWDAAPAVAPEAPRPLHARGGAAAPDATRCAGCHHVGGAGGSGSFGDLAFFDTDGDDALSGARRLPRMLSGAALLERAASADPARVPFGWAEGRPRTLREFVRWSLGSHLAVDASSDELDALTAYLALLPAPVAEAPPRDSLSARAAHGAEVFLRIGCADCHVERLTVEDPVLRLGGGRRIDLRWRLSPDGRPPFEVAALSDLRPHRMGALLDERPPGGPGGAAGDPPADRFVTAPLWGLASRGPFLHDGRASTVGEAILAHGGEAQRARDAFVALVDEQRELLLYLATLGRAPVMTWQR